ncbi:hypothetical protein PVAP13_4NG325680 [Panicum virgatum]|uniref:Uncharacterized protein n=1 Tax=Panicum virgatum TaxID=38727 RepID=A0A8T0TAH7_PANVG|nr:hypothetical protein PVAP13_4NG325680 [Panicum virgatum]
MLMRTTPDLAITGNGEAATALRRDSCHASSGRSASSSLGVGSARLGADPSGSQSSGGAGGADSSSGGSFLPLFPLPRARPWRCAEHAWRPTTTLDQTWLFT